MITITAEPTGPVFAYSDIVYSVTSDNTTNVGFSFVVDIYEVPLVGDNRFVRRLYKQPNQNGIGRFGIQKVFQSDLEFNDAPLGATANVLDTVGSKNYSIRFGEEFIVSGELVVHTGETGDAIGTPAVLATNITAIKGFRNANEGTLLGTHTMPAVTSNLPTVSRIHRDDTLTVSGYSSVNDATTHVAVVIPTTGDSFTFSAGGIQYTVNIYDEKSRLGEERFAFYNRNYGLDYLTADQEFNRVDNVTRRSTNASVVDYERATTTNRSINNPNVFRSGSIIYGVDFEEVNTSRTSWLETIEQYNNAAGIILSPRVWKRLDSGLWAEVEILTSTLPSYPNARQTENFNLVFDWKYSTPKNSY